MIRLPLEQTLALLWLAGFANFCGRLLEEQLSFGLAVTALLAGVVALYLLVNYRLAKLFFLPLLLGLAALLIGFKTLGIGFSGLMLIQSAYALASWRLIVYAEHRDWPNRVARLLAVRTEDVSEIESSKLPIIGYVTALLMLVYSVQAQLLNSALVTGQDGHSIALLLTLCCAMLFFWHSGFVGMPVLQSYLVIGLSVLALLEGVSLTLHPFSLLDMASDTQSASYLVPFGIGMCALSHALTSRSETGYCGIYARSLRVVAIFLAVVGIWFQALQWVVLEQLIVSPLDVSIPAAAAFVLLWANSRLRFAGVDLFALLLTLHALLALDYLVLHSDQPYDLRPGWGYPDQWLLLGLLGLLLATVAWVLERRGRTNQFIAALRAAAAVAYVGTLLAGITSFFHTPFGHGGFHLGIILILIIGQFFLLRNSPRAESIRGVTVPALLLAALCAGLAVIQHAELLRFGIAVYAFGLLFSVRRVLPAVNARCPGLAIRLDYPEWIGLVLVYAALLNGGPDWIQEWPWLLAVSLYQLLLRKAWLDLPALLLLVLAGLWVESTVFHPGAGFTLWPGAQRFADLWLCLALAAFVYAVLARAMLKFSTLDSIYRKPLHWAGVCCSIWAFLGSLPLLASLDNGSAILAWHYLVLLLALLPLSEYHEDGARLRDVGSSVLFALIYFCLWKLNPYDAPLWIGLLALGFGMWIAASGIIPIFSRLFPAWAFQPVWWPWFGLLCVLAAFPDDSISSPSLVAYFLALSIYGVLMLRYSRFDFFSVLPGASFTAAGIAAGVSNRIFWADQQPSVFTYVDSTFSWDGLPFTFVVNMLAWANLQLLLIKVGRKRGAVLAHALQLRRQDIAPAFDIGACGIMVGWLWLYAVWVAVVFWHFRYGSGTAPYADTLVVGLLLILSFLHGLLSRFSGFRLHCMLSAIFLTLAGANLAYGSALIPPPMFLAFWCLLLAAAEALVSLYRGSFRQQVEDALVFWVKVSLAAATLSLLLYPFGTLASVLYALLAITFATAFQGLWMLRASWFYLACIEFLVVLHLWPFLLFDTSSLAALLPWYALQGYVLTALLRYGSLTFENFESENSGRLVLCRLVFSFRPLLNALAFIELILHGIGMAYRLQQGVEMLWLFPFWDPLAAIAAGIMQFGLGIRDARKAPDSAPVYGMVLWVAALGCYVRLLVAGAAPISLWDTSLLILLAYGLFFMQRIFPSKALLHMALLTPLAALLTVPMQLQSFEASAALIATGMLYLLIRRYTQKQLPVYLALLAFNVGLYLWIPGIVKQSHLVQIYVIPAALSVLILLQLHRHELKPSVIMATRLAATSSIYACATLDVFLLPDLQVFVLALALSLAGIILGIALRIRAFLYAGVAFMLLNVFGQLFRFYPEQALGKAIVLMGAGMVILCAMIWFNLKKMQILQRIDSLRGELALWD